MNKKNIINPLKLHTDAFVLDSHCDSPSSLLLNRNFGEYNNVGHFDYPRMKKGGVDAAFFAIYTSNSLTPDKATIKALKMIAITLDSIESNKDKVALAKTVKDARELKSNGLGAIFLGMENGSPIQKDLSLLRLFYKLGVRYLTLTHSGNNYICDSSSSKEKKWNGVSDFGKKVIMEMNRIGMMIDVSHISDEAFYDVLKYSKAPVVATHSSCRALCNHPRNMTDQMIKDLAKAGGVIQINLYPCFIDEGFGKKFKPYNDELDKAEAALKHKPKEMKKYIEETMNTIKKLKRPSYMTVVDHIEHVIKLVGVDYVGIGSDFDGIAATPEGLDDISMMPVITTELLNRGYSVSDIKKILGENFLRVMENVEKLASIALQPVNE